MASSEPMSDARLAEALDAYQKCDTAYEHVVSDDYRERVAIAGFWNARNVIPALLAEVERLRAALAAKEAREAALVAAMRQLLEIAELAQYYAPGELGEFPERVAAYIDQARALLASADEAK